MKVPIPRSADYFGMCGEPSIYADGTWLEPEELTYPSGAMLRKAYADCPDGKRRVCLCGIPDTFFSIPARCRINGKSTRGFLSANDLGGMKFTPR